MLEHIDVGAQVLQATLGTANSIFYLSPMSIGVPNAGTRAVPLRGGVPVLFLQVGDRGLLPKHGFARTARWDLREKTTTPGACRVRYSLTIPPNKHEHWAHACHPELRLEATTKALTMPLP
jgi:glucose-6-phosphate 1-epimerase